MKGMDNSLSDPRQVIFWFQIHLMKDDFVFDRWILQVTELSE